MGSSDEKTAAGGKLDMSAWTRPNARSKELLARIAIMVAKSWYNIMREVIAVAFIKCSAQFRPSNFHMHSIQIPFVHRLRRLF